jgi:deazaflavin-dependent oxidoreductase (nitroreductase family)
MADLSIFDQIKEQVRYFNKQILNPFTLSFAGRPHSPYAIIRHEGRTSGRVYKTPVVAQPTDAVFVIPLPYGDHVDWFRNLKAAGDGIVASGGRAYQIGDFEVVDAESALPEFPAWMQPLLEKAETEQYLRARCLSDTPEPDAVYQRLIADYPITNVIPVVLGAVVGFIVLLLVIRAIVREIVD